MFHTYETEYAAMISHQIAVTVYYFVVKIVFSDRQFWFRVTKLYNGLSELEKLKSKEIVIVNFYRAHTLSTHRLQSTDFIHKPNFFFARKDKGSTQNLSCYK